MTGLTGSCVRGKINFFDVLLDKYKCRKVECVKSVLVEFMSGVSIYPNKGLQSDLGTLRESGVRGAHAPALGTRPLI